MPCRPMSGYRVLLASNDRVALNLDLGVGVRQRRDRNERTAREIVAEYLSANFGEPIAIANVSNEHGHLNHVTELASRFFERRVDQLEYLPHLAFEVAGQRLARVVHGRDLAAEPHGLASLGNHSERVAALLRTLSFDVLLCVQRGRKTEQQYRSSDTDRNAWERCRGHLRLLVVNLVRSFASCASWFQAGVRTNRRWAFRERFEPGVW